MIVAAICAAIAGWLVFGAFAATIVLWGDIAVRIWVALGMLAAARVFWINAETPYTKMAAVMLIVGVVYLALNVLGVWP